MFRWPIDHPLYTRISVVIGTQRGDFRYRSFTFGSTLALVFLLLRINFVHRITLLSFLRNIKFYLYKVDFHTMYVSVKDCIHKYRNIYIYSIIFEIINIKRVCKL